MWSVKTLTEVRSGYVGLGGIGDVARLGPELLRNMGLIARSLVEIAESCRSIQESLQNMQANMATNDVELGENGR